MYLHYIVEFQQQEGKIIKYLLSIFFFDGEKTNVNFSFFQMDTGIFADAVRILLHGGLIQRGEDDDGDPVITQAGFQFFLLQTVSQVNLFPQLRS